MAFNLTIGQKALSEIREASNWYAEHSPAALERFLDSIDEKLDQLADRPESFTSLRLSPRFRRAKLRRFPFLVVFRVNHAQNRVFVSAFVHEKRDPEEWVKKLR